MTSLPVLIIGVNPFALEIAHIFQKNEVVVYGFLDDDPKKQGTEIGEIPVLGTTDNSDYWNLIGKSCGVFVALENPVERKNMIELIEEGVRQSPSMPFILPRKSPMSKVYPMVYTLGREPYYHPKSKLLTMP